MTLAAIMATVDFDPASKSRISLAAELAKRSRSLLIGVAGWPLLKRSHKELELRPPVLNAARNCCPFVSSMDFISCNGGVDGIGSRRASSARKTDVDAQPEIPMRCA